MRKALSVSDLREHLKLWRILVVVSGVLSSLALLFLVWTWGSAPDLARRNIVLINANFGLILVGSILMFFRDRRRLEVAAGIK